MMADAEPDEGTINATYNSDGSVKTPAIISPIPAAGRTYRGSIKPYNQEAVTGVQFLLGNMTAAQIRGAKMLMGIASVVNADQLPTHGGTVNNAITGDPRTGWVKVKIKGAEDLPVEPGPDGTGLAWTDLISFSSNFQPGDGEIVWRIWVPNRATAPYARTFSSSLLYGELSALRGLAMFQASVLGLDTSQNGSWMYYGYVDGDLVTNPALVVTWHTTPPPPPNFDAYSKDHVTATPVLGFRWKASRSLPVIEFVGDSITQGYGDDGQYVSVDGVPGRLIRSLGSGPNAQYTFINFGQSGWTPEQYLARWKGLAAADPNGATAMVYSIYSPNGFADGGPHTNTTRINEMEANCIAAEQAAHANGRIFIPCFITGTNMGLLGPNTARTDWAQDNTGLVKSLLDWALARYGNQLLDLHSVIQDKKTIGPAIQDGMTGTPSYTDDETHPNTLGYDTLGDYAVTIFPTIYANARAAQAKP
jgi:lysophospholipase L1-like esterase